MSRVARTAERRSNDQDGADTANPLAVQGDTARSRTSLCGSYLPTFRPLAEYVLQMAPALRREWAGWPLRPATGATTVTESHPGRGCRQDLIQRSVAKTRSRAAEQIVQFTWRAGPRPCPTVSGGCC